MAVKVVDMKYVYEGNSPIPTDILVWASLSDEDLEEWLHDFIWFPEREDGTARANCARTRNEIAAECRRRGSRKSSSARERV